MKLQRQDFLRGAPHLMYFPGPRTVPCLVNDDDQGIIDVEIEDTTLRQNETPDSLPGPSTSTAEPETEAQVTHQPAFKWTTNFDDLVHYIVSESVRYAHQNGREFTIEPEEMKAFFGMNLVMGYHVLPSLRDYWSTEPDMGVPFISNVMPRARFEEIRRNLHFCNNDEVRDTTSPNYDRAYKIRPIMDHFNASFQNALNNTEKQSIDEHMIKFKGHNAMKQYIKNKPVKWGFKLWCRCDAATGYLFEFDLYTGKRTSGIEYGLGESVILQLTRKVEGLGCEIYMDNFFNSPLLQYKLVDQNTKACGTVRTNRKHLPKSAPIDRSMKRGDIYTASFHGISYVKWMDNKAVHLLTNFLSPIEIDTVKRRKAGSADKIDVRCPRIVSHYNKNMGGVDLMDQRKLLTYSSDFGAARLDPCELRTVVPYTYTLSERSAELHGVRLVKIATVGGRALYTPFCAV
ncbi:PiggyBac transposable element-derived protein 4 [Eumeta japonica]|uniref:PiggyBac transposable element-derived protein 4 n=1 Tax=Eumeta variegata TaxID=151549 RepID=A0A4C2A478_EUMVA|nr:PiggyBac transposable element-derived protein 4 [Eumeta japonica]